jgi:hypothetical protein
VNPNARVDISQHRVGLRSAYPFPAALRAV